MSLKHKGYTGKAEYDDEAGIFYGQVLGLRDVITFQGTSVEQLEREFRESVDVYLEWCKEEETQPEKPYSGQFRLRVGPDIHKRVAMASQLAGESVNTWLLACIERSLKEETGVSPQRTKQGTKKRQSVTKE
jgi:predicted HicB family RNase H-like nuclease